MERKKKIQLPGLILMGFMILKLMKDMGETFICTTFFIEDIMNTDQRPKLQEYDNNLFLVLKMLRYDESNQTIIAEQLSLVIGKTFLLTFQEQPGDVFEPVRKNKKTEGKN